MKNDLEIKLLETTEEADSLVRLIYRTFGYTYHRDYMYDPGRILELQGEKMLSVLAVRGGEVVGHVALLQPYFHQEYRSCYEMGLLIIAPSIRKEGLSQTLGLKTLSIAAEMGLSGIMSKCVTNHSISQKACHKYGGRPVSIALGSLKPTLVFKDMGGTLNVKRLSTSIYYLSLKDSMKKVFLPRDTMEMAGEIYRWTGIKREITPPLAPLSKGEKTEYTVRINYPHLSSTIHITRPGEDLVPMVEGVLKDHIEGLIASINLLLPISSPLPAMFAGEFAKMGLFFGGILPSLSESDYISYQYLHPIHLMRYEIITYGSEGTSLLKDIYDRWEESIETIRSRDDFIRREYLEGEGDKELGYLSI